MNGVVFFVYRYYFCKKNCCTNKIFANIKIDYEIYFKNLPMSNCLPHIAGVDDIDGIGDSDTEFAWHGQVGRILPSQVVG